MHTQQARPRTWRLYLSAFLTAILLATGLIGAQAQPAPNESESPDESATQPAQAEPSWTLSVASSVQPGSTLRTNAAMVHTMTVTNTSEAAVTDAQVVADLSSFGGHVDVSQVPADAVYDPESGALTWSVPELEPGAEAAARYQLRVRAPARAMEVGAVFSVAGAGGECVDGCELTYHVAGYDITLSADPGAGTVTPGTPITYTWRAENIGGGVLSGAQVRSNLNTPGASVLATADLVEPLDDSLWFAGSVLIWDIGDLAPGEAAEVSFTAVVTDDAAIGATLRAAVNGTSQLGARVTTPSSISHTVAEPTWRLDKAADPPSGSTVQAGDTITYTLTVQPTGIRPVTGVVVADDLSGVLEHATLAGSLPPGVSIDDEGILTWTVRHPVHPNRPATLSYAVVIGDDAAGAVLANSASPASPGGQCLSCITTHQVGAPSWDLTVGSNAEAGSTLTTRANVLHTLTATSTAEVPVTGAVVQADLSGLNGAYLYRVPDGAQFDEDTQTLTWAVPDLQPGEAATLRYQITTTPSSRANEVVAIHTAHGAGGQCVTGCELGYFVAGFDASLSADPPAGEVHPGQQITYTWRAENVGGGVLSGAQVRSNLNTPGASVLESADLLEPLDESLWFAGSVLIWDIGDLDAGESAEVSVTVTVREDAQLDASLQLSLSPTPHLGGRTPGERTAVHTVTQDLSERWVISVRAAQANGVTIPDGASVRANAVLTYHLTASNDHPLLGVAGYSVTADVSGLMPYASIEGLGPNLTFDPDAGTVTWSVPALRPGADAAVTFRANLRTADAPGADLPISVDIPDTPIAACDVCALTHHVTAFSASVGADPGDGQIEAGQPITYTWEVTNTSNAHVTGAYVRAQFAGVLAHGELQEPLPEGVSVPIGTTVNWNVPDLGPGQSASVEFAVVVDGDAPVGSELTIASHTVGPASLGGTVAGQTAISHTVVPPADDAARPGAPQFALAIG